MFITTVGMEANGSLSTLLTSLKETQVMIVLQQVLHQQPPERQQQQDQLERLQQHQQHHQQQLLIRPRLAQWTSALRTAATF